MKTNEVGLVKKIQVWECGGGGKAKENQKKQKTMADSRLRGTLRPKIEKNPTGYRAREDTKVLKKRELSKSLKFIKPLRLSDEVDSSL